MEEAIRLTGLLAGELRYTQAPMEDAIKRLAKLSGGLPFLTLCAAYCGKGLPFPQAWRRGLEEAPANMEDSEREILFHLGAVLGAVDLEGALGELEYARFALTQRHGEAKARQQKLGGLYRTLGALAGAGIVIALM